MSTAFYEKTFTGHLLHSEEIILGHFVMYGTPEIEKAALRADDFYGAHNRRIYQAILKLTKGGEPIDSVMLARELGGITFPGGSGPHGHIAHLCELSISPVVLEQHVKLLKAAGRARNLSAILDEALDATLSGKDPDKIVTRINSEWEAVKACRE